MDKIKKIKQRFEKARSDRAQYENYIDTAFRYAIPQRRIYLESGNKLRTNPEVYDSTAVIGAQRFSTKMQSMLVPTAQRWMSYEPGTDIIDPNEQDSIQLELDQDTKVFFDEIKHSNFDIQVAESFQDLAVTTGALLINPAPIGSSSAVTFKAVPINELYVETPSDGTVKTVFREYEVRLDEITTIYVGAKLSANQAKQLEKDPNAKVKVTESCIFDVLTNTYEVTIIDMAEEYEFLSSTETTNPWVVFRENVVPGTALGFGRILRVLPDIKTLNKVVELTLKGGSISVSGTFMAHDDGVLNPYNVRLRPGGVIPVNSNDPRNPSIARLDTPTNFDWANLEIQQLQARINDVLLSNPFGSIENTPVRSATEIAARNRDLFDTVSSSFGRMQTEFVSPVINRVTDILQRAGRISDSIILDGRTTSFKFISPLTRLQQSADIENVLEWLSVVGTLGEEVTNVSVKVEDVPRWLAKQYAVPMELVRTQGEAQGASESIVEAMNPGQAGGLAAPDITGGGVGVASPGGLDGMY